MRAAVALALVAAPLLPGRASVAHADACGACPEPSLEDLERHPEFVLRERLDFWGYGRMDTYQTDGGECTYTLASPPSVMLGRTWVVLRGQGVAWTCPWGASESTASFSLQEGDTSEWKVTTKVSAELSAVAVKMATEVSATSGRGTSRSEVKSYSQTVRAAMGHVLEWTGSFTLGEFTLDATYKVTRRYAWWTKNESTGDVVHAKGNVMMDCGTEDLRLTRQGSLGVTITLTDSSCDGTGTPLPLGPFPPPSTPPAPPVTPGAGELPSAPAGPLPDAPPAAPPAGNGPLAPPADDDEDGCPPTCSGDLPDAPTGPLHDAPQGDPAQGAGD